MSKTKQTWAVDKHRNPLPLNRAARRAHKKKTGKSAPVYLKPIVKGNP